MATFDFGMVLLHDFRSEILQPGHGAAPGRLADGQPYVRVVPDREMRVDRAFIEENNQSLKRGVQLCRDGSSEVPEDGIVPVRRQGPEHLRRLVAGAVHKQVKRASGAAVRDGHVQGLLPPGQGAELRNSPAQAGQLQQARHETGGLEERQPEEGLEGQADLDRGVAAGLLTATPPRRDGLPLHRGIEPDGQ